MKSRTDKMVEALKDNFLNATISGQVAKLAANKKLQKHFSGIGGHLLDEALFHLPSKNKTIKKFLDEYSDENPTLSKIGKGGGLLVSGIAPGGVAVKGLSKIDKLNKILKGSKWYNTAAKAATYNVASEIPNTLINETKGRHPMDNVGDVMRAGLGGAMFGAAGHGLGFLIKPVVKSMGIKNPFRKPTQIRDDVGRELYHELDKKTINKAKEILANPIESKNLNLNTLVHRATEDSKSMVDNLYQKSDRAREILEKKYKELAEGQMPYLREKIMEAGKLNRLPDTKSFVERKTRQIKKIVEPMYDKAYEVGDLDAQRKIPLRLRNDVRFEPAVEKAYSEMNLLDKQKPTYEKYSVRNLHDAKEYIGDDIGKFGASGDNKAKARVTETYNMFRDMLNAASPEYEKATSLSKKYFDIGRAAEGGLDFKNQGIEEIAKKLKDFSQHERTAYKTAAVESLLKTAEKRSQNSKLAELGKDFTNPEIKRKLNTIIGEENLNQLVKDIEISNDAVNNLREVARGSGTAKHMSNKSFFTNTLGAAKGSAKGVINILYGAGEHIKESKAKREAALKLRLLLNPKKLLEFKNIPPKESGNFISALSGLKNMKDNTDRFAKTERMRRRAAEMAAERKAHPERFRQKTYAEEIDDIYKKYGR